MNIELKMLENAIAIDQFDKALALIENGVGTINHKDRSGATLLMRAIVCNNIEMVNKLLKMGADVNATDKKKYSPLHFAVLFGFVEIASILIHAGANIDSRDIYGNTPLLKAVLQKLENTDIMIDLLLKNGASIKEKNNYGKSYENFGTVIK